MVLIFQVLALQSILAWVVQLANGRFRTLAQLDAKPNCSHPVFVGIHELPP